MKISNGRHCEPACTDKGFEANQIYAALYMFSFHKVFFTNKDSLDTQNIFEKHSLTNP